MDATDATPHTGGSVADISWHADWIKAFSGTGNVSEACAAVQIDRATAYRHRKDYPDFAEAWQHAAEKAADTLEREAWRRAVEGVEETYVNKKGEAHTVHRYSDLLLIFLLKGHKPDKFKDRKDIKHEGSMSVRRVVLEDETEDAGG